MVTNGALGLLPLSLLPTAPALVDPDGAAVLPATAMCRGSRAPTR